MLVAVRKMVGSHATNNHWYKTFGLMDLVYQLHIRRKVLYTADEGLQGQKVLYHRLLAV